MVEETNRTQEQWTVIAGHSASSLGHNPGVAPDSTRTFLGKSFNKKVSGQAKTSSKQLRLNNLKLKLSKPLAALSQVAFGRASQLSTTYKQLNPTKTLGGV